MEDLINRIPLIASFVFDELDNQSLLKCTEVSKEINNFMKNEKIFWLRIIQKYGQNLGTPLHQVYEEETCPDWNGAKRLPLPKHWKKTVDNSPLEFVRELAEATERFFSKRSSRLTKQWHPLFILTDQGLLQLFMYVCEKTGEINPKGNNDFTVLHMACQGGGHEEICEFIINNVEDKNPQDGEGFSPLYDAASRGHSEICKIIIENVNDKNPANNDRDTPLHAATQEGHLETCKIIIKNAKNKNPQNVQGYTPLYTAAYSGHLEICKMIIDCVNNANLADNVGNTPLHAAAQEGHLEICKLILNNVENKNPENDARLTPLYYAILNGHLGVCRLIVKHLATDPIDQTWIIPCYLLTLVIKIVKVILKPFKMIFK